MIATLALALAATPPARAVDVGSLLREMADLSRLAQRPDPWYRYRQWTSYDRDMAKDPYANADFGKFLRDEGSERVMADVRGPGALVRLWSANPAGTLRFYFDGESKPRLVADMADLLSGKSGFFPAPFAYVAARGANLYFPLPFAKGLKVTWDGGDKVPNSGLYYAVGIREYASGTKVTTFTAEAAEAAWVEKMRVGRSLFAPRGAVSLKQETLPPGGTMEANFGAADDGELDGLVVRAVASDDPEKPWTDPTQRHNVLRRLRLRMAFDGETTVDVPLGDFFGSAASVAPFASLPITVQADGKMACRWAMPFQKRARIWIVNGNPFPVSLRMGAHTRKVRFNPGTYLFHAGFHAQTRRTRPMYDFTFADLKGEGRYVGSALLVSNPASAWWGEGDEKVRVDGEAFPSLFGTGTEDYFGYAWSDPTPFARPYHAQPKTPNLGNLGQTENLRFHVFDDIPYRTTLRFDMEAWHWADVDCTYATTAFWYARPGTTRPPSPDPAALAIPEVALPLPVKGAIEAEGLKWTTTEGHVEMQAGFPELSGGKQFWWRESRPGATATVEIPVPAAGRYEIVANLGHARDYGRFRVTVNGAGAKEIDLYQPTLEWRRESLGTFDLPAGKATIRFENLPANPASVKDANMLGVDYFLLQRQ